MKRNISSALSGLFLVAAGGLAFAAQLGYLDKQSPELWIAVFGAAAVVFFVCYLLSGIRAWGWLFPAFISGALALMLYLGALAQIDSPLIAAPLFIAIGLPFLVPFALAPRQNWWALIPAWTMLVLSVVMAGIELFPGEWMATVLLLGIGLPFLLVFLLDRESWWALIPAYACGVIAFIPVIAGSLQGEFIGAFIMFMIGLPFLLVYLVSKKSWWAILPAGGMLSLGLMFILLGFIDDTSSLSALGPGFLFLGLAVTFWLLWLRRDELGTDWARYPVIVLLILAAFLFLSATGINITWPLILIAAGILLLYYEWRHRRTV